MFLLTQFFLYITNNQQLTTKNSSFDGTAP